MPDCRSEGARRGGEMRGQFTDIGGRCVHPRGAPSADISKLSPYFPHFSPAGAGRNP